MSPIFDNLRTPDRAVPLLPIIDRGAYYKSCIRPAFKNSVRMNLRDDQLRRQRPRWAISPIIVIIFAVIFAIDASSIERQIKEFVTSNVSEGVEQVDKLRNGQKGSKNCVREQITYNGDQVWRIYKNNSSVDELVERYDEHGT